MRHIHGINYDKARVSATLKLRNEEEFSRYVSSKLSEKYTIYNKNKEEIGVIQVRLVKVEGKQIEGVHYAGEFSQTWFNVVEGTEEVDVEQDDKVKGSVTVDKEKWGQLLQLNTVSDGNYNVSEFIYESYTKEEVLRGKDLTWLKGKDYRVLRTKEELDNYIELLQGLPKDTLLGLDTETTGLRINHLKTDDIVGISISHKEDFGVYIPLKQKNGDNQEYTTEEVMEKLKPIIDKNVDGSLQSLLMNAVFDWKVFKMYGIEINVHTDLMFMLMLIRHGEGYELNERDFYVHYGRMGYNSDQLHDMYNRTEILLNKKIKPKYYTNPLEIPDVELQRPRSLKGSIEFYFGYDVLELSDMFKSKSATDFDNAKKMVTMGGTIDPITKRKLMVEDLGKGMLFDFRYAPEWFYTIYGPADADFPIMLYRKLTESGGDWEKFKGSLDTVMQIEMSNIETIGEQEFYGVYLDEEGIINLGTKAKEEMSKIEEEILSIVGHDFNFNSPKEKAEIMFEELNYPKLERFKTKTGGYSTGKETLDYLVQFKEEDGSFKYPLANLLKKHSKLSKQISSFYDSLPKLTDNGFLNPSFHVMGAATGRISCSEPNVQQMEPSSRAYILPREGMYFSVCDFSQVERRLMGGLSGDPGINQRFIDDKEADSHIQTYANMMNVPYELVDGKMRKIGKTLNFATGYGISAKNLAITLYGNDDKKYVAMAQDLINKYFESVPVYKQFSDNTITKAKSKGYSETYFGRRRNIKEYNLKNPREYQLASGDRAAVNMVVQGTAADILKLAMARLRSNFRKHGYFEDEARMVMNVHDEVSYEIANHVHPYIVCHIMKTSMEVNLMKYGFPPLYAGMNLGHCWKDGKRDDLEAPVILMEEMSEKGRKMLELPKEDRPKFSGDPVDFWRDEIIKFSIREAYKETRKGYISQGEEMPYKSLDDFHKNMRVTKYVGYLEELEGHEPYVDLGEVSLDYMMACMYLMDTPEEIYDNHLKILKGEEVIKDKVINILNNKEDGLDYMVCLGIFGNFAKNIESEEHLEDYELCISKGKVSKVKVQVDGVVKEYTEGLGKKELKVDKKGEELQGSNDLKEKIRNNFIINGNVMRWKMETLDKEALESLDKIGVDLENLDYFNTTLEECYSLMIELPGGTLYAVEGWILKDLMKLVLKIVKAHYLNLPYLFVDEELDRFAQQLT